MVIGAYGGTTVCIESSLLPLFTRHHNVAGVVDISTASDVVPPFPVQLLDCFVPII